MVIGIILWQSLKMPEHWYAIGFGISALLILLLFNLAWAVIKQDKLSYNEYWNGYELVAKWGRWACSRDSGCAFTFNCDPYQEAHYSTTTDSNGNTTTT